MMMIKVMIRILMAIRRIRVVVAPIRRKVARGSKVRRNRRRRARSDRVCIYVIFTTRLYSSSII